MTGSGCLVIAQQDLFGKGQTVDDQRIGMIDQFTDQGGVSVSVASGTAGSLGAAVLAGGLRRNQRERALPLLAHVGLQGHDGRKARTLSGGMQQRVLIAIALGLQPQLLIADEPTTGLDALSAVRILELLRSLKEKGMAVLFISHDLKAVAMLADQAGVMCKGRIVESGPPTQLLTAPQHSYTSALVKAGKHFF